MSLSPETRLGPYEIVAPLGEGGMGEVYRARDLRLGREVAVKVLPERMADDRKALLRFEREAQAVAALTHPSILTLHDVGTQEGTSYVVTELLEGENLRDRLERGPLEVPQALEVALAIARGLAAAHAKGIVHRDVKPSNIFLTTDGQVKILDFGVARIDPMHRPTEVNAVHPLTAATATGHVIGTLAYMAPEQLNNQEADFRSDQFSFGCVVYEMLAGQHPFARETLMHTMMAVVGEPAPRLSDLQPEVPAEIERMVERCLEKDPAKRYASTSELVLELNQLWGTATATLSRDWIAQPARRRRAAGLLAGLAAGLVLALGIGYAVLQRQGATGTAGRLEVRAPRQSAAVLGFKNLSGQPEETEWLATALSEMFGMELAAGNGIRLIPGENVARLRLELALPEVDSLGTETLERVRLGLGTDFVLTGAYLVQHRSIRIDVELQETTSGATVGSFTRDGPEEELFQIVDFLGHKVRQLLGAEVVSAAETGSVRASMPRDTQAARLYAEGLESLRGFDTLEARDLLEQAVEAEPSFPLSHLALAEAWAALGYDARAVEQAGEALELSQGLPREELLEVKGLYQTLAGEWDQAVETYGGLWSFFPDNIEYGLHRAQAQLEAGEVVAAQRTIEELRHLPEPSGDDPRIDLLGAKVAEAQADHDRALEIARRAAEKGEALGIRHMVAQARFDEGYIYRQLGRLGHAMDRFSEAERLWGELGDRARQARALQLVGVLRRDLGDLERSRSTLEEALAVHREIGHRSNIFHTLNSLAETRRQQGDLEQAREDLEAAIEVAREVAHKHREATGLNSLGLLLYEFGELEAAERAMEGSRQLFEEIDYQRGIAWCLYGTGKIELATARVRDAGDSLESAYELCRELGNKLICGHVLASLGDEAWVRGDDRLAGERYGRSLELRRELNESGAVAETLWRMALFELESGRPEEAEKHATKAVETFAEQRRGLYEGAAETVRARALLEQGKVGAAAEALERARGLAGETAHVWIRLDLAETAGRLASVRGEHGKALARLEECRREAEALGLAEREMRLRLVLAEAEIAAGKGREARDRLEGLAAESSALGMEGIARRASAAAP